VLRQREYSSENRTDENSRGLRTVQTSPHMEAASLPESGCFQRLHLDGHFQHPLASRPGRCADYATTHARCSPCERLRYASTTAFDFPFSQQLVHRIAGPCSGNVSTRPKIARTRTPVASAQSKRSGATKRHPLPKPVASNVYRWTGTSSIHRHEGQAAVLTTLRRTLGIHRASVFATPAQQPSISLFRSSWITEAQDRAPAT